MPPSPDDRSSLFRARDRLYTPSPEAGPPPAAASGHAPPPEPGLPRRWPGGLDISAPRLAVHHVRLAGAFLIGSLIFFVVSLGVAAYFFYAGGNSVSNDKIDLQVTGPATIAGGDTVPLSVTIVNKNPTSLEEVTLTIDFPEGTRSAVDVLQPYPRYIEELGTLLSGERVTRSVKAVLFASAGETIALPLSLSYRTVGSNSVFVKKLIYTLTISSTPLSVSVETLAEAVAGQPFPLTLTVRSNASVPLDNVVVALQLPFGYIVTSSSLPLTGTSFLLGTLQPGASAKVTLAGALSGQAGEQRVFRFTVGTARGPSDSTLAVTYMTQDASVAVTAPFISTALAVNGNPLDGAVFPPGASQTVSVSYTNTLPTSVTGASVRVTLSGSALDYARIEASRGFYDSASRTITFSPDTDPALALLAPGASGVGTFTFSTLPADALSASPTIRFTVSVAGERIGQTNVPEAVANSSTYTARVATGVSLGASSLHSSGPIGNSGPVPPVAGESTTYTVVWSVRNSGNTVAGASVTATLPPYSTYTDTATGGSLRYAPETRTLTWALGELAARGAAQTAFQVSITPSTLERGSAPALVGPASFSGYDRFAGIQVQASAPAVTTETSGDPGYVSGSGTVQ